VPTILIGVGAVLLVFTFLLAFTIFGEISALLGVACIVIGALLSADMFMSRTATDTLGESVVVLVSEHLHARGSV
jgi:hypothetical protein